MIDLLLLLRLLVLLGVANGVPLLVNKVLKDWLSAPVDGGLQFFDGRRLLGRSKTIRGIVVSMAATSLIGLLLGFELWLGALLAGLSLLGDLASSFLKRRFGYDVHAQALGLDQVPEALIPLVVLKSSLALDWTDIGLVVLAFVVIELFLSRWLYKIGIREKPY
jgi:hypothetical protein